MVNDTYKKIGERVKQYRLDRGLSQPELAEGICSRQTISLLENGQHFPSADFMKKIAIKLGVPFHEIIVDEVSELESKVQLDIIKIYVEVGDYAHAFPLIEEMSGREELLEYQQRELIMCHAECLIRTGKADHAVEILTELLHRLERGREAEDHFMATLYDKIGTAYHFMSNIANAYAHYMRAYQLTLRFSEFDLTAARIAYNLGMACRQLNYRIESIEYLTKAEKFFKGISDSNRLAHVLFELGIAFKLSNELERADQYLQESLALYQSLNMLNMATHVRQFHAFLVLSQTSPDEALKVLKDCASGYEDVGNFLRLAYTHAFTASILLTEGKHHEAKSYLDVALSLFSESDAETEPRLAYVYQVNARYLYEVKQFEKCIEYSFKASEIFDKIGLGRDAADSLSISAKAYREQKMFEQAYNIADRVNQILCRIHDQFSARLGAF